MNTFLFCTGMFMILWPFVALIILLLVLAIRFKQTEAQGLLIALIVLASILGGWQLTREAARMENEQHIERIWERENMPWRNP
jgi:membrane protein implicated in regulation of membrane protease activity